MNNPRIAEMKCPNQSCDSRRINRHIYLPSLPFERLQYIQLDADGKEIAKQVVYRCRYCGYEFTFEG